MRCIATTVCRLALLCACSAKKESQGVGETADPNAIQAPKQTQSAAEQPGCWPTAWAEKEIIPRPKNTPFKRWLLPEGGRQKS